MNFLIPIDRADAAAGALNGHQARADDTRARLLSAAEEVFASEGFENAQLAAIAKRANRTKGSIYGHFESKDDLFLALYEHHSRRGMAQLMEMLKGCETRDEVLPRFKEFVLGLIEDKTWSLLTLEFKLYAVRHPESRERLTKAYDMTRLVGRDLFHKKLYGRLSVTERKQLDTATAGIAPIISAMTLEAYFEPMILSEERLRSFFDRIFDVIFVPTKSKQV